MLNSSANISLPRSLPRQLVLAVFFRQTQFVSALILFLFFGIFSVIFIPKTDTGFLTFRGKLVSTTGTILAVEGTGSRENKKNIYSYTFSYQSADAKKFTGESFSPGSPEIKTGDSVPVEYSAEDPSKARISGMRNGMFSSFFFIFTLQFLLAIFLLISGIRKARKNIHLLRNGMLTTGEITGMESTNAKINNQRVYNVFFRYTVNGTVYTARIRTHKTAGLKNEKQEPLLYDSNRPGQAMLLDALPPMARKLFESGF